MPHTDVAGVLLHILGQFFYPDGILAHRQGAAAYGNAATIIATIFKLGQAVY